MRFRDLDLATQLLVTRRGTAYFSQRLADIAASAMSMPTLLDGWSRKHLVAHVAYNAAALCRLLDWATSGRETPMYASTQQRTNEIAEAATLSADALSNLHDHCIARLNRKWRSMPESAWAASVRTAQGRTVPASETVWMRCREVWVHAVDLDNGGQFSDFPSVVLESLMADIVGSWRRNDVPASVAADVIIKRGSANATSVSTAGGTVWGSLAAVVRWASGRGAIGVATDGDGILQPPRWL